MKKTLLTALLLGASVSASAEEVNIVNYGGAWGEAQQRAVIDPFARNNPSVTVNVIKNAHSALAALRTQLETGNITYDVIDIPQEALAIACEDGLVENFNHDEVLAPAPDGTLPSVDFLPGMLKECVAPQVVYSIQFGYNPETYGDNAPKTLADVFDVEQFPGKRGLQRRPYNNLEWALIADGVDRTVVRDVLATDEGLDRAFAKLDTIKDHIVWWDKAAAGIQQLSAGQVQILASYNGRFWKAKNVDGQNIEQIWDAQIYTVSPWVVAKGQMTPEVKEFIRHATSTETLAQLSKIIPYSPTRRSSIELNSGNWTSVDTGTDMESEMVTNPKNFPGSVPRDGAWWAENGERINERWEAWLLK